MRLYEKAGVPYKTISYPYDDQVNIENRVFSDPDFDIKTLFKTLVIKGDKTGIVVAVVPLHEKLSLKKLSKVSGNKKMTLLPLIDLQKTTGYVRGGCSPLGMRKQFPTFFDSSLVVHASVAVNAGQKGFLIQSNPEDLLKLTPNSAIEDILM